MLNIVVLILLILIAAAVIIASTRPDTFEVMRSLSIKAPAERIYPLISDLRAFNTWNPFLKKDPATKVTYSGPPSGVGAAHDWEGNGHVGKGRVEITGAVPASSIAMQLDMLKPMEAHNQVQFTLEPMAGGTNVIWAMRGKNNMVSKLMGLVVSMDSMVGGEFEKGLKDLKGIAEK